MKPIVYGNVARYFGKKREEDGHTHQWTVYVKPYRNEVQQSRFPERLLRLRNRRSGNCHPWKRAKRLWMWPWVKGWLRDVRRLFQPSSTGTWGFENPGFEERAGGSLAVSRENA